MFNYKTSLTSIEIIILEAKKMKANWTLIIISAMLLLSVLLEPEQDRRSNLPESDDGYSDDMDDQGSSSGRKSSSRNNYNTHNVKNDKSSFTMVCNLSLHKVTY